MKIEVHPSLEVSPRQVNKGWRKHKGELKKAFEEIGSDVEDRLARTEALKRIVLFLWAQAWLTSGTFPFCFPSELELLLEHPIRQLLACLW